ncbi:hypothetical protein ACSX1A_10335 [Pontibacter sp. MBLB2868]|uniref:hypothetical protein n=1 Tax=Pontibacter sp. MBLB2868 TaxID=3451555 RepID=UPI003F750F96
MKKLFLITCLSFSILSGCSQSETPEEHNNNLESQVMEVHDGAMEQMNTIYHLRKDLRALRDTLTNQEADTSALVPIQVNITQLNEADEAMMNWMRQYKAPVNLTDEQAREYLQNELLKIERVKTLMDSTIQAARSIYRKYEKSDSI